MSATAQIELTRCVKASGPLTKTLHLTPDGKIANDSTQCRMSRGKLERVRLDDWRDFGALIEATPRNAAWALGALRDGLPDVAQLVLKGDPQAGSPGYVARTQSNFLYRPGAPAFVLLDYDTKGMPAGARTSIEALGGFIAALAGACPALAGAGYIERRSTSAAVRNSATGETYPSEGRHLYLPVADGADAQRFLDALHERAWLAGLGWHWVGRAGQLLERSLVDRMVGAPERLVFEAAPDLEPPLEQGHRPATVHDGAPLDTLAACADLTARDRSELERLKAVSASALKGEAAAAEAAFVEEQVDKAVARGMDPEGARAAAKALCRGRGVLCPGAMLEFDDKEIGTRTVADVLADPVKFDGKTLADPIEGVPYGRNCAIVQIRSDASLQIYSFAHGGAIYRLVRDAPAPENEVGVSLDDFHAYMPAHSYIFAPTREMWPATSVNSRLCSITAGDKTIPASVWLDRNKPIEQMTWAPGAAMLIRDRLIADGGWVERKGVTCFNLYRPPTIKLGDAGQAGRWIDLVRKVYPDDADHITKWFAHRVQRPEVKINHALVLGGSPGIGKDTILEPVKRSIGPWNFGEASPTQALGRFNGFLKSVILRISEARDLGEFDRFAFYDHMKTILAAPPDTLRVDEKHLREHYILNCVGAIITTNHKTDGIFLPPDDRRHYVAWSEQKQKDFETAYWNGLWGYYEEGGYGHVAAYLRGLDISTFDPKAPPLKTQAFWAIVDAGRTPEDAELADLLDGLGNPSATTILRIVAAANVVNSDLSLWIQDRKNRRLIPHRLEKVGYVPIRNEFADDGLWKLYGKRQVIYAKSTLSIGDRSKAAKKLVEEKEEALLSDTQIKKLKEEAESSTPF